MDLSRIKYAETILDTIGQTPLVKLNHVTKGLGAPVLAKVEFFNPGGSVKDRIGLYMIEAAIAAGDLKPGGTIVECTSGNTGAGLAIAAAVMGYRVVFTMPDKMSKEKIRLLKAFGAEVIMCPTNVAPDSEESYYSVAKRVVENTPNSIHANQYFNPKNPQAHYDTTGPELWQDSDGQIDYFVAGVGTGGTISGVGRYLKEQNPEVKIIGVDPEGSLLKEFFYTKKMGDARPYLVEGIGEDILPTSFEYQYVDEMITVSDMESFAMARRLSREEGLLVGGSCGSAAHAAIELAKSLDKDKLVVVLLPDTGERYLSKLHSDDWMRENRMLGREKLTAGELLRSKSTELPPVAYVDANETVHRAVGMMKEFGVTQMPVKRADDWVGKVTEGDLLDQLIAGRVTGDAKVGEVMAAPFPMLDSAADRSDVLKLFSQGHMAVLVADDSGSVGIVTKSDLVDQMLAELE